MPMRNHPGLQVGTAKAKIAAIVEQHSKGRPMRVFAIDSSDPSKQPTTCTPPTVKDWLRAMDELPDQQPYCLDTGDGHHNPVINIVAIRNRRSKEVAVLLCADFMFEYSDFEDGDFEDGD